VGNTGYVRHRVKGVVIGKQSRRKQRPAEEYYWRQVAQVPAAGVNRMSGDARCEFRADDD
jgi:hypothetical protein